MGKDVQKINSVEDLSSEYINRTISVVGVVNQIEGPFQYISAAVYECKKCNEAYEIYQPVGTIINNELIKPDPCCGGKSFKLLKNDSKLKEAQIICILDSLEKVSCKTNNPLKLVVNDNLLDVVTLGKLYQFLGTLNVVIDKKNNLTLYLKVKEIKELSNPYANIKITEEDENKIKKLAEDHDIFNKLVKSIAPIIYGYNEVKEAILCSSFGGADNAEGSNLNILIIGDSGTGKTTLLNYISKIRPNCLLKDGYNQNSPILSPNIENKKKFIVNAGMLNTANNGNLCIDDIDQLPPKDKVAITESLKRQTVTVTKSIITKSLPADASIISTIKPKNNVLNPYDSIKNQISLSEELISEFDLILLMEDKYNKKLDMAILNNIKYGNYEESEDFIDESLFKKYIIYAKNNFKPKFSKEAEKCWDEFYLKTCECELEENTKHLRNLINLSIAFTKAHLREEVTLSDAKRSVDLYKRLLKNVGIILETGKIDVSKLGKHALKSGDRLTIMIELIKKLENKYGRASINILLSEMEFYNVNKEKSLQLIYNLKQQGIIFEPQEGQLKCA